MFEVSELSRRLDNILRLGRICEVDVTEARVKVRIGQLTTGWLPWLVAQAGSTRSWSVPSIGEQVLVLAPGGELQTGAVLCGLYQEQYPAPSDKATDHCTVYEDGTCITYDTVSHTLSIDCKGDLQLKVQGQLSIQGNITVQGNIQASGDILSDGQNSNHHKH